MAVSIIIIHIFQIRPAPPKIDRGAGSRQWGWIDGWILLCGIDGDELAGFGNGSAMANRLSTRLWVGI